MRLLIFSALFHVVFATRDEFTCQLMPETGVCWFKSLARDAATPNFVAKSNIPAAEVTKTNLGGGHGSHLHVLTSDICQAFPNLRDFNAQLLYLHELEAGVFENCHDLEVINLEVNRLQHLDVDLFKNNQKLRKIHLADNLLQSIDLKIFNGLTELEELDLNKNQLKSFSVAEMPKLSKLHWLTLHKNELKDLNLEQLFEKCPKLAETGAHLRLCPGNRFEKDAKFKCDEIN
ncbi:relaxin receptor 1-like [Culicoides brevitarsis]|uniref:relaxin receptor 1-like n=1 Tax=Culicoides brevitarsis TaxID=469753 RepID=UPI00307C8074